MRSDKLHDYVVKIDATALSHEPLSQRPRLISLWNRQQTEKASKLNEQRWFLGVHRRRQTRNNLNSRRKRLTQRRANEPFTAQAKNHKLDPSTGKAGSLPAVTDDLPLLGMLLTRMLDGFDGKEPASAGFLLADVWTALLQPQNNLCSASSYLVTDPTSCRFGSKKIPNSNVLEQPII